MSKTLVEKIIEAFYDSKTGLTKNIAKLKERNPLIAGLPTAFIRETLNRYIDVYNKNKMKRKIKDFVKYHADYVGEILHADLMFLNSPRNTNQFITIKNKNDEDNRYLLIIVDTYSRFIWVYPLQTKSSAPIVEHIKETINFIKDFWYGGNELVKFKVLTDAGKEFSTKLINKIDNTKHIISKNVHGAALAEAAIYKIRTKIKYLNPAMKKMKFKELISILNNINSESDANKVIFGDQLVEDKRIKKQIKVNELNQGDYVRIINEKGIFEKKSGLNNYSNHIFIVLQVHYNEKYNVYRYKVGSTNGRYESMKKWYEEELEKVSFTFMERLSEEEIKDNNDFTKEDIKKFYLEK